MKLMNMQINEYISQMGSDSPAPGGGSASALCGAQGAALVSMVAALTIGKKKYEEHQALCLEVKEKADALRLRLEAQVDADTDAFNLVSAAFKLPKETDQDKAARRTAIADATLVATRVPFETMGLAMEAMALVECLIGKSNANAASDLGVAALNLQACVKGAWLNVLINLPGVKDEAAAAQFGEQGAAMARAAQATGDAVFHAIKLVI